MVLDAIAWSYAFLSHAQKVGTVGGFMLPENEALFDAVVSGAVWLTTEPVMFAVRRFRGITCRWQNPLLRSNHCGTAGGLSERTAPRSSLTRTIIFFERAKQCWPPNTSCFLWAGTSMPALSWSTMMKMRHRLR
jgi:hypothetical protein